MGGHGLEEKSKLSSAVGSLLTVSDVCNEGGERRMTALLMISSMLASDSRSNTKTLYFVVNYSIFWEQFRRTCLQRLRSAAVNLKEGFSVVAPINFRVNQSQPMSFSSAKC